MKAHWLFWVARILAILIALFVMLFSFDVFEGSGDLGTKLLGFLIHNIPSIVMGLLIWLTWKKPLIAGLIFSALALFYFLAVMLPAKQWAWWPMALLPLLVGLVYLADYWINKPKPR